MQARFWGAAITLAVLAIAAILCLYQAYLGHIVWFST